MALNEKNYPKKLSQVLNISSGRISHVTLVKQAIDARRKSIIQFNCAFTFEVENEEEVIAQNPKLQLTKVQPYKYPKGVPNDKHVVVIGSGPAGLFCAYQLARSGQKVTIIERGSCVEQRETDMQEFFAGNAVNPESNVQFGEGGAGTFSDGKLTSGVKDERKQFVLETFVKHGATKDVLYLNKPHIGTDYLQKIVKDMREYIKSHGGEILFDTKLVDIVIKNNKINSIVIENQKKTTTMDVENLVLAIGHSARDTYAMLYERGVSMMQKPFAVGLRIEHGQEFINQQQYGSFASNRRLQAADYKLAVKPSTGRGVYTFCMCPGGKVINSSSEKDSIVVNGMSNYARDEVNANSAIVVTVDELDFGNEHPLAGIEFQRKLENTAFVLGGKDGSIPVQRIEEFLGGKVKVKSTINPTVKPQVKYANLQSLFSQEVLQSLQEGLQLMDKKIAGFTKNAVLSGVESRTSAPVRIVRNEDLESSITGIYPIGEGAGYAGGIMSSAIDGLKCAEILLN